MSIGSRDVGKKARCVRPLDDGIARSAVETTEGRGSSEVAASFADVAASELVHTLEPVGERHAIQFTGAPGL